MTDTTWTDKRDNRSERAGLPPHEEAWRRRRIAKAIAYGLTEEELRERFGQDPSHLRLVARRDEKETA